MAIMKSVQLHNTVIVMTMAACCFVSVTGADKIAAIVLTNSETCPSEYNMGDNAVQQLQNTVSEKLCSIIHSSTTPLIITTISTAKFSPVLNSTLFGGAGAGHFDDYNENITGIVGMRIRAGDLVDSIQVTYRLKDGNTFNAPMHGGTGGSEHAFNLTNCEYLTRIEAKKVLYNSDAHITGLTLYSNMNNTYGPYGGRIMVNPSTFSVIAAEIVAFFGRSGSGDVLNAIGVYYTELY